MLKKLLNIQGVAVFYTLVGILLVELLSRYPWANYTGYLSLGGISLIILYGWISKRYLAGSLYMITIASFLYIGYWFGLYYLRVNLSIYFNLHDPAQTLNLLPMSINLVYFWIIITGGIIGYIAQFKQRRQDYKTLYRNLAEMNLRQN